MNFRWNFLLYKFLDMDIRRWKDVFLLCAKKFLNSCFFILLKVCSRHTSIYFLGRILPQGKIQYSIHTCSIYFVSDETQLPRNLYAWMHKNIIFVVFLCICCCFFVCFFVALCICFVLLFVCLYCFLVFVFVFLCNEVEGTGRVLGQGGVGGGRIF